MAALAVVAQLYPRPTRDNPPVWASIDAPHDVERILRRSCYDCHSNETRWPWYSHLAPRSWLVAADVHEARVRMNFSEWPEARPARNRLLFQATHRGARHERRDATATLPNAPPFVEGEPGGRRTTERVGRDGLRWHAENERRSGAEPPMTPT